MSDERSPQEIEHDIDVTREKLAENIEALKEQVQERLSPAGLKDEAVHRLEDLSATASASLREAAIAFTHRAEAAGDTIVRQVRSTSLPLAAIGAALGLGYLLMDASRRKQDRAPLGYTPTGEVVNSRAELPSTTTTLLAGAALVGGLAVGWMTSGTRAQSSGQGRSNLHSGQQVTSTMRIGTSSSPVSEPNTSGVRSYSAPNARPLGERAAIDALASHRTPSIPDDETFKQHFETHLHGTGRDFDYYAHAYRYGAALGKSNGHDITVWDQIELYARRAWEGANDEPWSEVAPAVRHGWERTKTHSR